MRRTAIIAAAVVIAAIAAGAAHATNECRGLQVCVPVAGPWVVSAPGSIEYQLSCPKNYIVGGLDAELTSRGIDIGFFGTLGSPVNPGITTSQAAVFLARLVQDAPGATFRPHIGCVPATGGGRRTPTALPVLFPPGKPTERHVVNITARAGTTTRAARCSRRESLVTASYALGFRGNTPPGEEDIGAIRITQRIRNGLVTASVHAPRASHAVVQLDLVCALR